MSQLLYVFLWILSPSDEDIEALRQSAPSYLTTETARENLSAARFASTTHGVDPSLVLAIAWNESRYTANVVTQEPQGKISCGVMTPIPTHNKETCKQMTSSLLAGYLAGAEHLRTWFDVCRGNQRCAILGYAGGYRLINACKEGPVYRGDTEIDKCVQIPAKLVWRAKTISKQPGPPSKTKRVKAPQS